LKFPGDGASDCGNPIREAPGLDKNNLKTMLAIGLFVDPLESQRFLKADSSRLSGSNEAEVPDEEDVLFEDCLVRNSPDFARKTLGDRESEVSSERDCAEN
jgi:hypothetical protein